MLEGKQRHIDSSLHLLHDGSALAARDLASYTLGDAPTAMFRLDTLTVAGPLDAAVASVLDQLAAPTEAALAPVASWTPFLGELDHPTVAVLSRVASDAALRDLFSRPTQEWSGVPVIPDARRTTRLLRSASGSPIH